jgi:hypothetical protein
LSSRQTLVLPVMMSRKSAGMSAEIYERTTA